MPLVFPEDAKHRISITEITSHHLANHVVVGLSGEVPRARIQLFMKTADIPPQLRHFQNDLPQCLLVSIQLTLQLRLGHALEIKPRAP